MTMPVDTMRRHFCLGAAAALAGGAARAQTNAWPSQAITFVVPFAAGTATDVLARTIAEPMSRALKVAVVVDNKVGASASIGATAVARARPDGHTLLLGSSTTHAANAALFHKLSYDPIADFTPIALLGEIPQVMVVHPSVPATSVAEFVGWVRSQTKPVDFAQGSSGNLLTAAILNARLKLGMQAVAYRSPPPALVDVMGGHVPMMFADLSVSHANIRAGKLRALAVSSLRSVELLPDVPPLSRTLPDFELASWIAMWGPAGTPASIVATLNRLVLATLGDAAVARKLRDNGFTLRPSSPAELGLHVAKETVKWAKYVNEAGLERQ